MKIIQGRRVWTYTMQGTVPDGVPDEAVEGVVRSSVAWSDSVLTFVKGSTVKMETLTADELARRTSLQ